MHDAPVTLETRWLEELFVEAGLTAEQAGKAAAVTARRLLRRERPVKRVFGARLRDSLLADPLVSVNRILGLGDTGLPFYDEDAGTLSEVAFTTALAESGLDADVALAFAKVVVEAFTPEQLFQPVWTALGQEGALDLNTLRQLDWSPLRGERLSGMPPIDPGPPPPPKARKTGRREGVVEGKKVPNLGNRKR